MMQAEQADGNGAVDIAIWAENKYSRE